MDEPRECVGIMKYFSICCIHATSVFGARKHSIHTVIGMKGSIGTKEEWIGHGVISLDFPA
jgi:hypothetical protein